MLAEHKVKGMLPGATSVRVRYQPKGAVGVISPWNYPLTLAVSDAVAALMAGNAVVIKPDSQTPTALALAELLYQAGAARTVRGGARTGRRCRPGHHGHHRLRDVHRIVGDRRLLAEQAGRRLISFSAELGGKNPLILTASANLDEAVPGVARACYSNSGQLCISIEWIYVDKKIADEFTTRFAEYVKNMTLAGTYDFNADMGSLALGRAGRDRRGARRTPSPRARRSWPAASGAPTRTVLRADRPDRRHRGSHLLRGAED